MTSPRKDPPAPDVSALDPWMTLPEAGAALGIHPQTVKGRIAAGLLVAQVVAGRLFVRRDSVEQLRASEAARAASAPVAQSA